MVAKLATGTADTVVDGPIFQILSRLEGEQPADELRAQREYCKRVAFHLLIDAALRT